jgi:hypothetical protein
MISRAEAIDLYRSDDLIAIGMAADAVRRKLHPEGVVSYIIDRNINYTNFCTEYCSFCAFYRPMGHAEGYVHSKDVIFAKIQENARPGRHRHSNAGRSSIPSSASSGMKTCCARSRPAIPSGVTASPRPRSSTSPKSAVFRCTTRFRACATRGSIPCPAAAPRFSTTRCVIASAA